MHASELSIRVEVGPRMTTNSTFILSILLISKGELKEVTEKVGRVSQRTENPCKGKMKTNTKKAGSLPVLAQNF